MKILIIGSGALGSLEGIYYRAMLSLGESVEFFDLDPHMAVPKWLKSAGRLVNNRATFKLWSARTALALIRHLSSADRCYQLICIFKGMQFSADVLREGRSLQRSAVWININPDDPFNLRSTSSTNLEVIQSIPIFDLYCIWSRRLLEPIKTAGCRDVMYLPFGYDPALHFPPALTQATPSRAVSFVGAWDKEREKILASVADLELRISGGAWGRVSRGSALRRSVVRRTNIFGEEMATEVYLAAATLNIMRSQNTGAHNMRTFEVPAIGGLLLTTRSEEQEEYFPEGKASLMFGGNEELREKIKWVLSNPIHASKIRIQGRAKVLQHTYKARVRSVLDEVCSLRGERRAR